jgi:hypothetical protein
VLCVDEEMAPSSLFSSMQSQTMVFTDLCKSASRCTYLKIFVTTVSLNNQKIFPSKLTDMLTKGCCRVFSQATMEYYSVGPRYSRRRVSRFSDPLKFGEFLPAEYYQLLYGMAANVRVS